MRSFLITSCVVLTLYTASAAERPNILWITCEDISPYLGSYGCAEAYTPHLDKLAETGVRFTRAYANAPVCAVARATLLNGMYATSVGTHQMRCRRELPASIPAYPHFLRAAGYYCTNNGKKDYNSQFEYDKSLWNDSSNRSHWRNREQGQPFFAVFNIHTTHESQLHENRIRHYVKTGQIPARPRIDPKDIVLPPYHPDLPEIREDWARLHDLITRMDEQMGVLLRELEDAGEADNTIVFFYSDHGGMLSRSKRYIYNVGTQVPLIVRFPEKWQHLAPAQPGGMSEQLVSFVDFAKTVLSLAAAEIPELMQGRVFLGENVEPEPKSVHFFRDRMSERPDFSRAVTDGRYYFIRHFMPHRPPGRDSRYGFIQQANWRVWEEHFDKGKCDATQAQFFQPKPVIELFDTQADPWHVSNLAGDPAHRERIDALSRDLDQWMIDTRDTGLIPEALVAELIGREKPHKTLYEYAQSNEYPVAELLEIAKTAALGDPEKIGQYLEHIVHSHPAARYHGAYGLFLTRNDAPAVQDALRKMIAEDPMPANRVMAAQALGRCGDPDFAFIALRREIDATKDGYVMFYALNALQYSHLDDRLTLEDWKVFKRKKLPANPDKFAAEMPQRIINDAIALFPERRIVD